MRDAWGEPIYSQAEIDAERADVARLLGYEPDVEPFPMEHCKVHGDFRPLDLIHPECHWCLADDDDWRSRRNHVLNLRFNDE